MTIKKSINCHPEFISGSLSNMSRNHNYYVYLMMSTSGVIYIGVTNNLIRRVEEHKDEVKDGFTKEYHVNRLVHYEWFTDIKSVIAREKQLKNWHRDWKLNLIKSNNSLFRDLYPDLLGE